MRFSRVFTFAIVLSNFAILGQGIKNRESFSSSNSSLTTSSRILKATLSDSVFYQLILNDALYDPEKNKMPFYVISKTTAYDQSAAAALIIKKTRLVNEIEEKVIKKNFSSFLTKNFELVPLQSLSVNQNLNHHWLYPLRINEQNQIEELVEYEIEWKISQTENIFAAKTNASFKNASVLSVGNWYKIGTTQTGLHKINRSFLNSIGINTSGLDPRKIRIYGNGGKMLPEKNKDFRYDDLEENAIQVIGEEDGKFDSEDYILFYATGTTSWKKTNTQRGLKFRPTKSLYSDTSFYFINVDLGNGKRVVKLSNLPQTPNASTSSYDYYNFHEENIVNFGKSGRDFFGEFFDFTTSYKFTWNDGDFVTGDTLIAEIALLANGSTATQYSSFGNGIDLPFLVPNVPPGDHADYAAYRVKDTSTFNTNESEISITISKLTQKSVGWVDRVIINARRKLNVKGRQFNFRDSRVSGLGKISNFNLTNSSGSNLALWNVSDPILPLIQAVSLGGNSINFTALADSVNEYCVAPESDFFNPTFVGKIANQNLHGIQQADYLIITHPLFTKEAQRLGAFHQQKEGLTYAVATIDEIYNEFSSGKQDISAIRDFIRMLYTRNISSGTQVKYVLLMGDGSYNNKTRELLNNSNLIPTYQSINSLSSTQSTTSDDFYALMDPDEGFNAENFGSVDVGVGRFTCRTVSEVKTLINKIENYYKKDPNLILNTGNVENCNNVNESVLGDWRNWLVLLADDEDGCLHMSQSNQLSGFVNNVTSAYNYDKIFLDAYQRFSTPGGPRYPGVTEDIVKRLKKGALVFNYTGHGGAVGLAAERIVDIDMINKLDNFNKLPLFITATCEFSRYDDPNRTSAGELCLLNPKGGAISLLTTSRLAYADPNFTLNSLVLENLFKKLPNGKRPALGDVVRKSKATLRQLYYFSNFHLLGDPALVLAFPEQKVITSKINNVPVTNSKIDTLKALSKITISGFVADTSGNKLTGFNGIVYPTVFDKELNVTCLVNSAESQTNIGSSKDPIYVPFEFKLQKNILYRGKSLVKNGEFSFTFIVPKDISFAVGPGKISYYATDGLTDASGSYSQLAVGGVSKDILLDNEGPQTDLFLNEKNFANGGLTNEKPVFYADLVDSSGINTVGTGLGHDITVVLDEKSNNPIILNDYYEANLNSYQSGRIRYPFNELSEGEHRLTFKVWDIQNNSSVGYSDFIVAKSEELALNYVLNYPNPFTTSTKFLFQHNQACNPLKVTIQVYTISGKLVKTIQRSVTCEGFRPEGIEWNGRDDYGDKLGRGVYIYKLGILDPENKKAEKIEKLVILN